ncbi:hypothetical protein BMF94_6940 [Rhodotorula taiwanensis]|uniref:Uncharacterized protein n=1 Tax=Rhodotorula taiwanensis TaxID=741276 RepID=A0A2S5AZT9_9BASI|nr:hypothetical protein BMF94_6940 [Rhodotorula taiwanensis]
MADLEAGGSAYSHPSRRRTGHTHHGQPRTEEDLSSTAVVWDNELREWRSQEEEVEGRTLRSRTPEPSHDGIRQSPTRDDERLSEVTVAEGGVVGEKQGRRESVAMDPLDSVPSSALAAKEFGDGQPIWLEWEKGDPENPFNWSPRKKWQTCLIACVFTLSYEAQKELTTLARAAGGVLWDGILERHAFDDARVEVFA